ncbi:MAG: ankyrin repeat domain-containing protein [Akkermansia sp.]
MKLLSLFIIISGMICVGNTAHGAEEARSIYYLRFDDVGDRAHAPKPKLLSADQAYDYLHTSISDIPLKTRQRFIDLWNKAKTDDSDDVDKEMYARIDLFHDWIKEIEKSNQSTDALTFLIVDAQNRWNNHYCDREKKLIFDHIYRSFSSPEPVNTLHILYFLQHISKFTPFYDGNIMALLTSMNELPPLKVMLQTDIPDLCIWRMWRDPASYASAIMSVSHRASKEKLLSLLHDNDSLMDKHIKSGLRRWRYTYGKNLPACITTAMQAMRQRYAGEEITPEVLTKIDNEAGTLDPELLGFIPRCKLAVEPMSAPWKSLGDSSASLFLMPDTSAVNLPQWNNRLLGTTKPLAQNCEELGNLVKKADKGDTLKALKAFALIEGDQALPDGYGRNWMNVDGYDSFRSFWALIYKADGIDISITNDGPKFSKDDPRLRKLSRELAIVLHRCILQLALLEKAGNTESLQEGCKSLAKILNQYDLWPLLCNQYSLRGISPEVYATLLTSFQGKPELFPAFASISGMPVMTGVVKALDGGMISAKNFARLTREFLILNGDISATDAQRRTIATSWVKLAQDRDLPTVIQYLCLSGMVDIVDAWDDIPEKFVSRGFAYTGNQLVKHALAKGNMKRAEQIWALMIHDPQGYSMPETRLAKAALETARGEVNEADRSMLDAMVLTSLHVLQNDFQAYVSRKALLEEGKLDEVEKLLILPKGRTNRVLLRYLVDAFAKEGRYEAAAFRANDLLHLASINATPSKGLGSQADIVELRVLSDTYRALSLYKQGQFKEARSLMERSMIMAEKMPQLAAQLAPALFGCTFLSQEEREGLKKRLLHGVGKLAKKSKRSDIQQVYQQISKLDIVDLAPVEEIIGVHGDNYDRYAKLESKVYDWHLLLNGKDKVEPLKARIVRANYSKMNNKWVTLQNEEGRMQHLNLNSLLPDDIDHLIDWKKQNEIRSWNPGVFCTAPIEGKLVAKRGGEAEKNSTGSIPPEYIIIRLSTDVIFQINLSHLSKEDQQYVAQWKAPVEDQDKSLKTFPTLERAQAYAESNKLTLTIYLLGKHGGPEDEYFQKNILNDPKKIKQLNHSCAVVVCYQDNKGVWDVAGRSAIRLLKPKMDCISPPGTDKGNNPYQSGYVLEYNNNMKSCRNLPIEYKLSPQQQELLTAIKKAQFEHVKDMITKDKSLVHLRLFNRTWSPLYTAIIEKKPRIIQCLLENGANVNDRNHMGHTMLYAACLSRNPGIIDILLAHGADPNLPSLSYTENPEITINQAFPLDVAQNNKEMVQKLIKAGAKKLGALNIALLDQPDAPQILKMMTDAGIKINERADIYAGCTLSDVIGNKCPQQVARLKTLFAAGVDPNFTAIGHHLPISDAVMIDPSLLPLFIKGGVNPNAIDPKLGITPLIYFAQKGEKQYITFLLDHGADIKLSSHGNTVMHAALQPFRGKEKKVKEGDLTKYLDVLEYLISKGCDINKPNGDLLTPLAYARKYCHQAAVDLLIKHGAKETPPPPDKTKPRVTPQP